MDSRRYCVVFSGKLKEGMTLDEVRKQLAATFNIPLEKAERILTGRPMTLKHGLERPLARKYVRAFEAAGVLCSLVPESEPIAAPPPTSPAAAADETGAGAVPTPPPATAQVSAPLPQAQIAGFWLRSFAFVLDTIFLAGFGWVLGAAFFEQFVRMGQAGRLIGLAVGILYFGLLDSAVGRGQTPGKRLMGIRVIDAAGSGPIPLARAALRYLVFSLPFFCNNLTLPFNNQTLVLLLGLIVFGMGGVAVYLYLFNRRTRQSLHDLATRTLVVRSKPVGAPPAATIWRGHLVAAGLWIVLIGGGSLSGVSRLTQMQPFPDLLALQQSLLKTPGISAVRVGSGVLYGDGEKSGWTTVTVTVNERKLYSEETADQVAAITLSQYPEAKQRSRLTVTVVYGYDIGISSAWKSINYSRSPEKWARKLNIQSF
ncbi:MAG TPA: RDD family protein [Desulfuromonadales bacterium]|nr:RDD family protein [Desulfuromonadales bacterium]